MREVREQSEAAEVGKNEKYYYCDGCGICIGCMAV